MDIYTGTKSVVLSLDPRGVILNGGIDVASRQNKYGYQIKSQTNNLDFVIFSSQDEAKSNLKYNYVSILHISKPTFNSYAFAKKVHNFIITNNLNVKLLIAGDPW